MKPSKKNIDFAISVLTLLEKSNIETFAIEEAIEELKEIREFHY